jgi:hypothetical protein
MAKQTINIGTTANDGTGDPIRAAFGKVNDNFTEIYTANTGVNTGDQNLSAYATTAAVAAGYQPLDSDLTAISALTTTAYGRALLSTADAATLRSAIGVGQTDAPTFAGLTSTGAVLARGGLNLSGDGSFGPKIPSWTGGNGFSIVSQNGLSTYIDFDSAQLARLPAGVLGFGAGGPTVAGNTLILARDADGILAQRNGTSAQAFRVYDTYDTAGTNYERGTFGFPIGTNTLRIGTEQAGTGAAQPIDFVTGGVVRMSIAAAGGLSVAGGVTANNLITGNGLGGGSGLTFASQLRIMSSADGVMYLSNNGFTDFNRIQLGHTADTHPAIARDGAGIKFTGAAAGSTSWIKVPAVAVSALPSASTAGVGARSFVNDAMTPVFGSAVSGLGSVTVPVYSTGSAWNVG